VEERRKDYETTREVFWASGACLFIRAKLYHKTGGLEERFFAHMEEIDLCWRLKNKGYKIYCCAESEVYHVGGATLASGHPRKTYLNFHNSLAVLAKNLPSSKLFSIILFRLILDHVAAYRFLFKGQAIHFIAVAKAHFVFLTGLNKWMKSRDKIKSTVKHTGVLNKSIVLQYFLIGKKYFRDLKGIS
jgi:GT2 family glycosyltransferase